MTFYLFSMVFRSWGSVERGPTYFTCLLQIPVHHHSDIYSPILPLEEGYRIQAFSCYPYLVQQQSRSLLQLRTERTFFKRLPSKGQDSGDSPGGCRRNASRGRIGKRLTLKEDSSSGLEEIDMSEVDLSQLMGGKRFTIHCTLLRNG